MKVLVALEFVVETYVMPLFAELVLLPASSVLVAILALARSGKKDAEARKLAEVLLGMIGLFVLGFAIYHALDDYRGLGTGANFQTMSLPPLLSMLFIPYMYGVLCFVICDDLFVRLKIGREKPPSVVRYARRRIIRHCGLSLRRLRDLRRLPRELQRIESNEDVDRLLGSIDHGWLCLDQRR